MNEAAVTSQPRHFNLNIPQTQLFRSTSSTNSQTKTSTNELSNGTKRNKPSKTVYTLTTDPKKYQLAAETGYISGQLQ